MVKNLISVSAIIKKGWQLYTENFQIFATPILIILAPYIILYLVQYFKVPGMAILTLILTLISIIINLWAAILFIIMIDKIYKKESFDINNLYKQARHKILSYLLVSILVFLIVLGGFILLIIPGIIFAIWYAFAVYYNILENKKGLTALKSSKKLVKGRWGKTAWRLIIPPLFVYFIVMIVATALIYLLTNGQIDMLSYEQNILLNALTTIILSILTPLFIAFTIYLFNSLKKTKQQAT